MIFSGTTRLSTIAVFLLCLGLPTLSYSDESVLSGKREILLLDKKGTEFLIGHISFTPVADSDNIDYQLHLEHKAFTDHFLSMKEMKCLKGPELWCRIPYPYSNNRQISHNDLRWLEHDLLFLFKRNKEFGANFWNGIYYRLSPTAKGLEGTANAIDLNILASPPDDLSVPPINEFELEESDNEKRWLPRLLIR